jgi:hypothetical protein
MMLSKTEEKIMIGRLHPSRYLVECANLMLKFVLSKSVVKLSTGRTAEDKAPLRLTRHLDYAH